MNFDHIRSVARRLFWRADTQILHLMLASASLIWAISLVLLDPPKVTNAFNMMWLIAPPPVWSAFFLVHVIGMNFCLFWKDDTPRCKQAVQFYGALLWISVTVLQLVSIGKFTPSSSLEVVAIGFIVWSIFRSGLKK